MRPGELVTSWVEERIDASRGVPPVSSSAGLSRPAATIESSPALAALTERLEALSERVEALAASTASTAAPTAAASSTPAVSATPATASDTETSAEAPVKKRRGRPPKAGRPDAAAQASSTANGTDAQATGRTQRQASRSPERATGTQRKRAGRRVPLHQAIIAAINEHGPMSAADIADAIGREGSYQAPRTDKPLDAATVNSRVSNPVYRSLFRRDGGRIALA